ncbi:hypothetical protein F975_02791 [Acinetobacter sp. ANC 3789]|uniref:DUF4870 family protein n=1 Tax=Acinetobacter sp. ANC 3789 TaxID=1217714 RepID=UPI0002CEEC91|nr:hypothetical protein [Acinetobacter sp. ANC 3789]ENU79541.1 hypothetical protein F975_02791 [Acinetobacter sp. ANC 3789]
MYVEAELQPKRNLTLLLYVLYGFAMFSAGVLAVVALIVNYVKRDAMQGTIYASHFTWQIRTVWWYLVWNVVGVLPFGYLFFSFDQPNVFIGTLLTAFIFWGLVATVSWIWIVYRVIRGVIALNDEQPMYAD